MSLRANKLLLFGQILNEEYVLHEKKTADYGMLPVEKTGIVGLMVRIVDKTERVFNLTSKGRKAEVRDENLEDTLMDIANYANMALVELKLERMRKQTSEPVWRRKTLLDIVTTTEKHEYPTEKSKKMVDIMTKTLDIIKSTKELKHKE